MFFADQIEAVSRSMAEGADRLASGRAYPTTTEEARDMSLVEREVMGIQEAIAGLTAGVNEHTKRLQPVLLPSQVGESIAKDAAEKDLGDLGNTLRQARQSIERLQRQFADLRFRLTI